MVIQDDPNRCPGWVIRIQILQQGNKLSAAAKDWASLADHRGPGCRKLMAMRMSPVPAKLIEFSPQ
jgi:hypothetical protein